MDEISAWKNFVESGRVEDYLKYCKIKMENTPQNKISEDVYENKHEWTDTQRTDYR
ncbi:MAG: hypothetical protein II711_01530 [Clostridia bacterium]|nr:hypothetical protein [Clostridia bacterium]